MASNSESTARPTEMLESVWQEYGDWARTSRLLKSKQELYVTTFPDCKTTVRVTWNGAGNQNPHWVE